MPAFVDSNSKQTEPLPDSVSFNILMTNICRLQLWHCMAQARRITEPASPLAWVAEGKNWPFSHGADLAKVGPDIATSNFGIVHRTSKQVAAQTAPILWRETN